MKADIFKEDILASIQSLFWSMGLFENDDKSRLAPINLVAQNAALELCVSNTGNYFRHAIPARVTEDGTETVTFAWLKNVCDRLLTNNISLSSDAENLYLRTEECKASLPTNDKLIDPLPGGSSEDYLEICPEQINKVAMHMHCVGAPLTGIFYHPDKKELWFEAKAADNSCMAKIALQDGTHTGFSTYVPTDKFMYMTRGLAALNPVAGRFTSIPEGTYLKTNRCMLRIASVKASGFGSSHKIWQEERKASQPVAGSRRGFVHILEACAGTQPAEGNISIDSLAHKGQNYLRFSVQGLYKMSRIILVTGTIDRAITVPLAPFLSFLKTYQDPLVNVVITPNYFYVVKEGARLGLCLK